MQGKAVPPNVGAGKKQPLLFGAADSEIAGSRAIDTNIAERRDQDDSRGNCPHATHESTRNKRVGRYAPQPQGELSRLLFFV
jgi:hypothetical protein